MATDAVILYLSGEPEDVEVFLYLLRRSLEREVNSN